MVNVPEHETVVTELRGRLFDFLKAEVDFKAKESIARCYIFLDLIYYQREIHQLIYVNSNTLHPNQI